MESILIYATLFRHEFKSYQARHHEHVFHLKPEKASDFDAITIRLNFMSLNLRDSSTITTIELCNHLYKWYKFNL